VRAVSVNLAFGDAVKAGAREAIAALHAQGVKTVMLSGDNRGSAEAAARALGIDEVRAKVLPADKAQTVAALRGKNKVIAMVGEPARLPAVRSRRCGWECRCAARSQLDCLA